jgi:hypothetical protein
MFFLLYIICMDKLKLELRRKKEAEKYIALFEKHKTIYNIALVLNVSRQCVYDRFKRLGILKPYKKFRIISNLGINGVPKNPAVYAVYFIEEPNKKYYGSTKNLNQRISHHITDLTSHDHSNKTFQELYFKYGLESLRYKVIKKCTIDKLFLEEAKAIAADKEWINKNSPFLDPDIYDKIRHLRETSDSYEEIMQKLDKEMNNVAT